MDIAIETLCTMFVDQAGVGMGWADIEAKVRYMNPALTSMLGLNRPEEKYGQSVLQFYDSETIAALENVILAAVMDNGFWIGELPLQSANGEQTATINYLFALKDDTGKPFSFGNIVIPKKQYDNASR